MGERLAAEKAEQDRQAEAERRRKEAELERLADDSTTKEIHAALGAVDKKLYPYPEILILAEKYALLQRRASGIPMHGMQKHTDKLKEVLEPLEKIFFPMKIGKIFHPKCDCPDCNGAGFFRKNADEANDDPLLPNECKTCDGTGKIVVRTDGMVTDGTKKVIAILKQYVA